MAVSGNLSWEMAILGAVCGVAGFLLGWRPGSRVLLPAIQGGIGFLAFALAWWAGGPMPAAAAAGGWAVGGTAASLPLLGRDCERAERLVLGVSARRLTMLRWITTGEGIETNPIATALGGFRVLAVLLVAAAATGCLLAFVLGSALLDSMNAFVARLIRTARRPVTVALLAWTVWSVIRVVSCVLLACACAAPLAFVLGRPATVEDVTRLLATGIAGILLAFLLEILLSRPYRRVLSSAADLEAAARLTPADS